ncbi:MAG TPA: ComEC/Rec2 family competence protein [Candidatus Woesebacteria bacterium]|nr:ComEC/Rec2 family competence protein [Candidatus Woesebacteria bacterium]
MSQSKIRWSFEIFRWSVWLVMLVVVFGWLANKQRMEMLIDQSMPRIEAITMKAMLWGESRDFQKEEWLKLKNSGVIHLLVISGTNVMILMNILVETGSWIMGRKKAIVLGLIILWEYVVMVGWQIPMVRAGLMMSWFYLAQLWGRKFEVKRALALTIGMMVLVEKKVAFETSFWLSLVAYIGVITANNLNIFFKLVWINLWIWPILAINYSQISLVGLITNTLLMGVSEIIVGLGFLGWWWLAIPMIRYLWVIIDWWGIVPMLTVKVNYLIIGGWYLCLIYWLNKRNEKNHLDNRV